MSTERMRSQCALLSDMGEDWSRAVKEQQLITFILLDTPSSLRAVNVVVVLSNVSLRFRPRCPGMMQKWGKPAPVLTSVLLPGVAQITAER